MNLGVVVVAVVVATGSVASSCDVLLSQKFPKLTQTVCFLFFWSMSRRNVNKGSVFASAGDQVSSFHRAVREIAIHQKIILSPYGYLTLINMDSFGLIYGYFNTTQVFGKRCG